MQKKQRSFSNYAKLLILLCGIDETRTRDLLSDSQLWKSSFFKLFKSISKIHSL